MIQVHTMEHENALYIPCIYSYTQWGLVYPRAGYIRCMCLQLWIFKILTQESNTYLQVVAFIILKRLRFAKSS